MGNKKSAGHMAALGILLTLAGLLVSGAKFGALKKRTDGKGWRK